MDDEVAGYVEISIEFKNDYEPRPRYRVGISMRTMEGLEPLPSDREIMEELKNESIFAHRRSEELKAQLKKRSMTIRGLSDRVTAILIEMIESRDKVNGYDKPPNNYAKNIKNI